MTFPNYVRAKFKNWASSKLAQKIKFFGFHAVASSYGLSFTTAGLILTKKGCFLFSEPNKAQVRIQFQPSLKKI